MRNRVPFLALIAIVALFSGALFYVLGHLDQAVSARDAATTAGSQQLLATVQRYQDRIGRLRAAEQLHTRRERAWRDSADALTAVALGVQADAERRVNEPSDSAKIADWVRAALTWRRTAEARQQEAQECAIVVLACQERAAVAEARVDSVTTQLGRQVLVGQCHINLVIAKLSCPSRTTVFVVGAVTGGTIVALTAK